MVLPVRIELTTSPLPRGCSTTELRQLGAWRVGNTLRPGCLARQAEGRRVGSAETGTPHRLRVFLHRLSPGRVRYWRRRGRGETRRRPTNTDNVTENARVDHSGTARRLFRNSLRGGRWYGAVRRLIRRMMSRRRPCSTRSRTRAAPAFRRSTAIAPGSTPGGALTPTSRPNTPRNRPWR